MRNVFYMQKQLPMCTLGRVEKTAHGKKGSTIDVFQFCQSASTLEHHSAADLQATF